MASYEKMDPEDAFNGSEFRHTHTIDDRITDPAYYDGVRTKRILAFIVDYIMVAILHIPVAIIVFFLGIITLSLGWLLFAIITPAIALVYVGMTMGGPDQATPGMKMMGIRIARLDGGRVDFMTAIVHSVIFWAANIFTSGFVLLIGLFTDRKRLVQDLLLGTVILRSDLNDDFEVDIKISKRK
ncbi:MAG: RDD family protein [Lentilitoribacter sp.]